MKAIRARGNRGLRSVYRSQGLLGFLLLWTGVAAAAAAAQAPLAYVTSGAGTPRYAPPAPASRPKAAGIMVAFREDAPLAARQQVLARHGLQSVPGDRGRFLARVQPLQATGGGVTATRDPAVIAARLAALRRDPAVRVAEPDYLLRASFLPNDPQFSSLWGLRNLGQTGGTPGVDIGATTAWDQTTGGSVVVAVIDTGVDHTHPDLRDNIHRDGGGKVIGYDYANRDPDPMDDNEHGTHVAGSIGAVGNNGIGIVGVCPQVKVMPLKFLDRNGDGTTSAAIQCIDFAIANGAHVINASWGGSGHSQLLLEAIQRAKRAGILFVAAAGNEGANNDTFPSYPANHNRQADNVISVAATDARDNLAGFSNYGANSVDIAAPGVGIVSTTPGNTYSTFNGTSMAAPYVSGAAALLKARYPTLTPAELKARLLYNTVQPAALSGRVTHGRLQLDRAIVPDTAPPGAPSALAVTHRSSTSLLLGWTASGDDGSAGAAARYDVRYSTAPITEATFAQAAAANAPRPLVSGSPQSFLLVGLAANRPYYLAMRAMDKAGNLSPIVTAGPVTTLASGVPVTPVSDNVEGAPQFSGMWPWAVTSEFSHSPTRSYTDSPGLLYGDNRDTSLAQNASVTLAGFVPSLEFRARMDLEDGYDFLFLELSTDGGATWQRSGFELTGTSAWTLHRISLASYYGRDVRVRFRFISDIEVTANGVWLDDIRFTGERLDPVGPAEPAPPAPPSGLTVQVISQTGLRLSWTDGSSDETGFRVDRRVSGGVFGEIARVGAGVTSFVSGSLSPNTTYFYRVCAFNTVGQSPFTSEASGTTLPNPPAAPVNLVATAGPGRVTLTWSASAGAATYTVRRGVTPGGPYTPLAFNVSGTSLTDTAVTAGVTYRYVVSASNAGGASPDSAEASATPQSNEPLGGVAAPTNLAAASVKKRITLTWRQSISLDIVQNRIYRATSPTGRFSRVASVRARTTYAQSLGKRGTYYYQVTAVNRQGVESKPSNVASAVVTLRR